MMVARADIMPRPADQYHPRNLYVACLPATFTEDQLWQTCEAFGPVASVKLIPDINPRGRNSYGFVLMETDEGAHRALEGLPFVRINGHPIQARLAKLTPGVTLTGHVQPTRSARDSQKTAKALAAALSLQAATAFAATPSVSLLTPPNQHRAPLPLPPFYAARPPAYGAIAVTPPPPQSQQGIPNTSFMGLEATKESVTMCFHGNCASGSIASSSNSSGSTSPNHFATESLTRAQVGPISYVSSLPMKATAPAAATEPQHCASGLLPPNFSEALGPIFPFSMAGAPPLLAPVSTGTSFPMPNLPQQLILISPGFFPTLPHYLTHALPPQFVVWGGGNAGTDSSFVQTASHPAAPCTMAPPTGIALF